jgi:hypothetical protein
VAVNFTILLALGLAGLAVVGIVATDVVRRRRMHQAEGAAPAGGILGALEEPEEAAEPRVEGPSTWELVRSEAAEGAAERPDWDLTEDSWSNSLPSEVQALQWWQRRLVRLAQGEQPGSVERKKYMGEAAAVAEVLQMPAQGTT